MAESFLYLHTTGRKSGLVRTTELWFVEVGGLHYVVSELADARWLGNLVADPRVTFSVGPRSEPERDRPDRRASARIVERAQAPEVVAAVRAAMDAKYDWSDGTIVVLEPSAG